MKVIQLIAALVVSAFVVSCNTMIGLGRDFKVLGEGMESSANKVGNSSGGGGDSHDTGGAPIY
ncbi:MAG: hypothetical protein MUF04_02715 [Akkermansiaceae bacterium]|jgi:predicted small secreted protein|nr:hypothetical protein [Akkermansiaceae bacterium]